MKKIILLSVLVVAGIVFGQAVLAENATLSVLPAAQDITAGAALSASVHLNPNGNKICVVKGVLVFDNLSCQSITVSSSVMAQVTPTCSSPNFTLGIPGCSSAVSNFITASAKGNTAGTASVSLEGVKVIGAGADIPFNLQNGVYNIIAVRPVEQPKVVQQQNVTQPTPEPTASETAESTETPAQETAAENEIPMNVGAAGLTASNQEWNNYFWLALIVFAALIVVYGIYYFRKNKKPKNP